ncbi:hypothetical protein CYY_006820 [Polysphondylium violaceum]|uniref:Uncharacterized protein n=1 Tax=Polysphondylium violaceum TaxID=133409 RepID=A0A8J4PRP6_9MYCE|nr:hypothetical protein CYY_006820 [Polysphondylium violaceum]
MCDLCNYEDCNEYPHDRKKLLDCINLLNILDENIKKFMQDNTIKIQDNLSHFAQEIRNNEQIITRLRELKQHIKDRLNNHYLQSLETEFSILENRISSSINQLTETKQTINDYLNNFNTKKSATQLLVQVLDWFKEKNSVCSYKIYSSTTFQEYDIIDQLLNSYYQSQQPLTPTIFKENGFIHRLLNRFYKPQKHSLTPSDKQQQQFKNTLKQCIDIKESIDTRPLLCYPIINSYKFFNLPKHPIVEPIINSQLDLFLNSKTTPMKNNNINNKNDNNNYNVFHILNVPFNDRVTRLFYLISKSKFQFKYLFFVKILDDYKNILIKLDKNFSHSAIVGDRQLIDLFNSHVNNLTSVLIIYNVYFYDRNKYEIQYKNSNIKTIIISDSDFKADHPNVNIFGQHVLEPLSNEGLELLFNYLTDSIVSKDDIFYKPLMFIITQDDLKFMIKHCKDIRNKTKTPNDIIYSRLSNATIDRVPNEIKAENLVFKFPVGEMLCSFEVNYFKSQTKQNNEWVPITIMQSPNECTDPYQLILTSEYAQIIVNNNNNGDLYNIKFDLRFKKICYNLHYDGCINLIPLSGTFESRSQGIQSLSLSNCFGSILYRPTQDYNSFFIEIDAIGYSFSTNNNNNNNQNFEKRIAIRLVHGGRSISFINIEDTIHLIGGVKFINDTDHTLIITSRYSRFANNNQLIFKCKDNKPILDTGNLSGNLCGGVILKDDISYVCSTCNTPQCDLCNHEDCSGLETKGLFDYINVLDILDENIKKFMQDNTIKIQDNLGHFEQQIRNNKQIITRLRELKEYIKNRLDNHYLQSLETEFSILENRISSSINQLTETKQTINNYLNNFKTKKSTTQLLVQVLDWFKEKNSACSYKIYSSTTFKEYDIIDQLLNSYYQSQHSLTPKTTPPTDQQQQFKNTLKQCIEIKESIDTRPLICYPIINSYKFFNLPKHPIVDQINNSQLDLFLNSKTTPRKNNNENDNNSNNNIDNVFHILNNDSYHVTRLFYYISESKFQFNYLFFVQTLDDYKNILIKLDKNFSHSAIVGDRQLIDLFNSHVNNLTSVLIIYHRDFYDKYKYEIQYKNSNIKTIIITNDSDFKSNHPNVKIFGQHVLEPLSNEGLELLFNNLTDSIVSKDDIFYKPLMFIITQVDLEVMIEHCKDIRNKTRTPNDIIYKELSNGSVTIAPNEIKPEKIIFQFSRSYATFTIAPSEIKPEKIIFKFPVCEMLCSFEVNYLKSQTKQNNESVPITIMQEPKQCTNPYQLIFTSEYAQIIVNNKTNGDVYNIKFDLLFIKACYKLHDREMCINLIPLSGTLESRSQGIQSLSLSNCFGTILYRQSTKYYHKISEKKIEIDAIGYSFSTNNNNNNNQNSEKTIAIKLESGKKRINFINVEGNIHFIGGVKFIKDTDHTFIITSKYSRFANNNQLIFKNKDNQPIPDRGSLNISGNLCGDIILKDGTIISFDIPAYINRKIRNKLNKI